jgi:nicotinamidase/pyrazinamidase
MKMRTIDVMPRTALIAVDVQNDYQPGGILGSPDSDRILEPLIEYATLAADIVIASRNLRPPNHKLFENSPASCVKGTPGAKIVSDLAVIVAKPENYVISKGLDGDRGEFSAFEGGTLRPLESLEDILRREEVTHIAVGGYWLERCVAQTAFDAAALGYATAIEMNCTLPFPGFDSKSPERAKILEKLSKAGVLCV